jgi:Icc protein
VATVLQLSDTHLRADASEPVYERDPDDRLAMVLAAWVATGERADAVLLTGDLADDGSAAPLERIAAAVAPLDCPVLAIPGNHDSPAAVAAIWGDASTARVGAWHVVGVDTTIPGEVHGQVDVPAVAATLDGLDDRPVLLALHHPPLSRSTGPMFRLDGAAELLDSLAARPKVRAVVAGHLHDAVVLSTPSGLPVLGAPSTLMGITHLGDDMAIDPAAPIGARVLRLEADGTFTTELLEA